MLKTVWNVHSVATIPGLTARKMNQMSDREESDVENNNTLWWRKHLFVWSRLSRRCCCYRCCRRRRCCCHWSSRRCCCRRRRRCCRCCRWSSRRRCCCCFKVESRSSFFGEKTLFSTWAMFLQRSIRQLTAANKCLIISEISRQMVRAKSGQVKKLYFRFSPDLIRDKKWE